MLHKESPFPDDVVPLSITHHITFTVTIIITTMHTKQSTDMLFPLSTKI